MAPEHNIDATKRPPHIIVDALVLSHRRIVLNEYEIVLHAPDIAKAARPGQFVMMVCGEGYTTDVRRPFSLFRVDSQAGSVSILYLARGSFTSELAQKQPGNSISLIGPLGRPFEWKQDRHARHILVAGGLGAPPIYFLAQEISQYNDLNSRSDPRLSALVINGSKSADRLIGVAEFQSLGIDLEILTEDGSGGEPGLATDRLQIELDRCANFAIPSRIYACGPMAMLREVASLGMQASVSCQISIETAMPCGVGECDGCGVRVVDANSTTGVSVAKACWDGPVFEASRLVWET